MKSYSEMHDERKQNHSSTRFLFASHLSLQVKKSEHVECNRSRIPNFKQVHSFFSGSEAISMFHIMQTLIDYILCKSFSFFLQHLNLKHIK